MRSVPARPGFRLSVRSTTIAAGVAVAGLAPAALAQVPIHDPIPAHIPQDGPLVRLTPLSAGLVAPNWGTWAPGVPDRLFVTDQTGILWSIDIHTGARTPFLDVSSRLVPIGIAGPGTYDERGLLGVAFHPDFATNGLFYTYESRPNDGPADFTTMPPGTPANHQSVVTEWQAAAPRGLAGVVPGSARELLRIDKPQFNHNAGAMNFGPDGYLYITIGDGGQADDQGPGHGPSGNAQDINAILGKILRIDVNTRNSGNGKYGIPPSNPFTGRDGIDEIYAYGLRNPFRFSFDRPTGTLWLADVGQNNVEEIDQITIGGNYGWRVKEGTFLFDDNGANDGFVFQDSPGQPAGLIDPVAEYDHDEGIAVVGGFVAHGARAPALQGRYLFGDYARVFFGAPGRLFMLDQANAIHELRYAGTPFAMFVMGFGQDAAGNVYVLANRTGVPGDVTGQVLRIDPGCIGDYDVNGRVEPADVALFVDTWARSVAQGTLDGDFDGDGLIQPADIAVFVNDWFISVLDGC